MGDSSTLGFVRVHAVTGLTKLHCNSGSCKGMNKLETWVREAHLCEPTLLNLNMHYGDHLDLSAYSFGRSGQLLKHKLMLLCQNMPIILNDNTSAWGHLYHPPPLQDHWGIIVPGVLRRASATSH